MNRYWNRWRLDVRSKQATLLLALLTVSFLVLALLVRLDDLGTLDLAVTRSVQGLRRPWLDQVMVGITFFGNADTLIVVAVLAAGWLWTKQLRRPSVLTVAALLVLPLNVAMKDAVGRPRPGAQLVSIVLPTPGLSFPSGHAMASTTLYGFLAVVAWLHVRSLPTRRIIAIGFALLAVLISLSRVYLGVHWASDIVGGWTLGLGCLLVATEFYRWGIRTRDDEPSEPI